MSDSTDEAVRGVSSTEAAEAAILEADHNRTYGTNDPILASNLAIARAVVAVAEELHSILLVLDNPERGADAGRLIALDRQRDHDPSLQPLRTFVAGAHSVHGAEYDIANCGLCRPVLELIEQLR